MDVAAYLKKKAARLEKNSGRARCWSCRKPALTCYCATLAPFASRPRFVILMHPLEAKHPVGTGRMAHRILENSQLFVGVDFTRHAEVNAILNDPGLAPMLLFPGPKSTCLTEGREARAFLFP